MSRSDATDLLGSSERELALRSMAELWSKNGYRATNLEQVSELSGVATSRILELFGDLEGTATGVVEVILGEVTATLSANYSADMSEWDSYLLTIKAILELMAAHPSFAYVVYIGSRQDGPPAVRQTHAAGIQLLVTMLDRLREYARFSEAPRTAARGSLGGPEAVVRREIAAGRTGDLPRLLPDFVYAATVPFLGQEESMRLARRGRELLAGGPWG
jgi:AcrR family transcriptional regulator